MLYIPVYSCHYIRILCVKERTSIFMFPFSCDDKELRPIVYNCSCIEELPRLMLHAWIVMSDYITSLITILFCSLSFHCVCILLKSQTNWNISKFTNEGQHKYLRFRNPIQGWRLNNWSAPQKSKKQEIDNTGVKFTLETKFKIERDVKHIIYSKW